jgi:hypothetical protein
MISSTILVADLLIFYPLVTSLFIELRVNCIGCSMNRFCTLEDLCKYYDLDLKMISDRIQGQVE